LGDVHDVEPTDDLFRATVGGIGAPGLVTEATFSIVPSFNLEQRTARRDLARVRDELPQLLAAHDHVSLYVFPFARRCQVNTWDRTERRRSRFATVREALTISEDAVATSVAGNLLAYRGWLPRWSERALRVKNGSDLVMRSHEGFNRSVYHQHEELEFALAADGAFDVLTELVARFESAYRRERLPFTFFEVRFTPGGHDRTFLAPGAGRSSVWIDVLPNQTRGFDRFYREVISFIRHHDGRPHLGKWIDDVGRDDLAARYGGQFARFLELRDKFDPHRRFDNPVTRQLFGS
jgi:L-gulonolactone oxidase